MYFVIGDSHCNVFGNLANFTVFHVPAATAFNLEKPKSTSGSKEMFESFLKETDRKHLILVFGEIDCRIHIYYQHKKQQLPISAIIDKTVETYGAFLLHLQEQGIGFMVCGIPPAGRQPNIFKYCEYATPEIHADIYREFNEKMKAFCGRKGYIYIDIYSRTVDPQGHIAPEYTRDAVHLNEKAQDILVELINGASGAI